MFPCAKLNQLTCAKHTHTCRLELFTDSVLQSVVLQSVAVCCSLLQSVAVCCSLLQSAEVNTRTYTGSSRPGSVTGSRRSKSRHSSRYGDACCSVLQWVVVGCSVLQWVAVCCSVLQCVAVQRVAVRCTPQCVAVCCSVLQCVAVCCAPLHTADGRKREERERANARERERDREGERERERERDAHEQTRIISSKTGRQTEGERVCAHAYVTGNRREMLLPVSTW